MSNIDIVKAFLDGMHKPISQVPDHLRASLTEDAEWGNSGFPPAVGIEDIVGKHEASQQVFGDYVMEIQLLNIAVDGDVVFTERIDVGRTQAGEELLTVPVVGVFTVRDGKIARWTDYFDPAGLLKHLGTLPDVESYFTGKSAAAS
ncbi:MULTISPECIES: limonene-1,2-epoxide hydrolase family protein [Actinomadura]|uniref:Limonene-1,2-epoxide hydrolase n=1 Tax=Actinomadura madurae TaxID=1993 RepID=A0A1I5PIQ8_9ACTN|nr:limonene-1,2-epoxide hydrolase family protein [Actinomadura madurae]SFP33421.1 limonene-1,2-epoxide hydrolase [Actinomadura madurae]SPT63937.1 Limonene-1,2-epoxide hydrolase [Actinomadura madurae]